MQKKIVQNITIASFIAFIGVFSVWNVIAKKKDFSENENRTLASSPELSTRSIFGGNFDDAFETWFSDHFVQRDRWIELKSFAKKSSGSIENNDVYYGEDGTLIKAFRSYSTRTIEQNVSIINEFCTEHNITGNIVLVPTAAEIEKDKLPSGSYNVDQKELLMNLESEFSNQNFIQIFDTLNESNEVLYYKTDHHWNERGAYLAYTEIAKQVLNKEPESFSFETVSNRFFGTMYSKSGAFWVNADTINKIISEKEIKVSITYDDENMTDTLYSESRLAEKDKYMYYLDGNHAHVSIQTSLDNDKKAVIVQDSYAHILMPYLTPEYETIEVIDLRYYHDAVSELIDEETDLYFIYSLDNFAEDQNLVFLK